MLAIRMQRTGRKGAAQFRVVVQDSRRTPTSGNIIALVGNYDPHAKVTNLDKEKIKFYLSNGAQPSDRVIRILQQEKIEIPSWVKMPSNKSGRIKNQDKLRKNRPAEEKAEIKDEPVAEVVEDVAEPEIKEEAETESPNEEAPGEDTISEDVVAEEAEVEEDEEKEEVAEAEATDEDEDAAETEASEEE